MARKRPKRGLKDKNGPEQEIIFEIFNTFRLARNAHFAHLCAPRRCQSVVLSVHMAKTRHSGRMFGQKTARDATGFRLARPEQEIMSKDFNTPRLDRNAHCADLGAPSGCQSVVLLVHMAKTRYVGRMFGQKIARKRPKRDQISAIGF
jgi:hypothetical protein